MGDGREGRWTSVGLFLEEKGSGVGSIMVMRMHSQPEKKNSNFTLEKFLSPNFEAPKWAPKAVH